MVIMEYFLSFAAARTNLYLHTIFLSGIEALIQILNCSIVMYV